MPRYRDAIGWIAYNDDNEWLDSGRISVTAAMVADLFNKTDEQVTADLRRALKRRSPMPDTPPAALAAAEEIVAMIDRSIRAIGHSWTDTDVKEHVELIATVIAKHMSDKD